MSNLPNRFPQGQIRAKHTADAGLEFGQVHRYVIVSANFDRLVVRAEGMLTDIRTSFRIDIRGNETGAEKIQNSLFDSRRAMPQRDTLWK